MCRKRKRQKKHPVTDGGTGHYRHQESGRQIGNPDNGDKEGDRVLGQVDLGGFVGQKQIRYAVRRIHQEVRHRDHHILRRPQKVPVEHRPVDLPQNYPDI